MGNVLVGGDFAQIECRVTAWLAGEMGLLEAFRQKQDIYSEFAMERIYPGIRISKGDPHTVKQRQVGKEAVLGCGFGMGISGFERHCQRRGITLMPQEAQRAVLGYRGAYPHIARAWGELNQALYVLGGTYSEAVRPFHGKVVVEPGIVTLPSGRKLRYDGLEQNSHSVISGTGERIEWSWPKMGRERTRIWGGLFFENLVQAIARDVMVALIIALKRMATRHPFMFPVLTVHDEVILVVPEDLAPRIAELLHQLMVIPPRWCRDLPIDAEISVGKSYYDI